MILPEADEFAASFPDEIRTLLTMLRMGNLGGLAVAECDNLDLRIRLFDYFRHVGLRRKAFIFLITKLAPKIQIWCAASLNSATSPVSRILS